MSAERTAWEEIRTAEEQGRRFCAEMGIEKSTALVPCWALKTAAAAHDNSRELLRLWLEWATLHGYIHHAGAMAERTKEALP